MADKPVAVVGGGIVGLAVALELTRRMPGREVVVFEREDRLASHQTGHNSGVVHAGVYYAPGSLKARLCTEGRELLREFCAEHDVAYEQCGKLVMAVREDELGRLEDLHRRSTENGVPGIRRIDAAEIREIEPNATGVAALHSPVTSITDFVAVAEAMADQVRTAGGRIELSSPVTAVRELAGSVVVQTPSERLEVERLVLCAGLQSDRVARLVDGPEEPRIVPFRGEYLEVDAAKADMVRGMVYPVPDPRYPFLGVHYTRTVDGRLELGPNAVLALDRDGYRRSSVRARDVATTLLWPGFWQLAAEHWRTGVEEVVGSVSTRAYMRRATAYVPGIGIDDVRRSRVGLRAQAVDRDGSMVDDFRIDVSERIVSVRNAPSPAATSSLAIGRYVVDRVPV